MAGELVVIDREMGTGRALEIDCTKFGSGSYGVPIAVEELGFRTKAKFILAIETGGIFDRLNRHRFWETADCILVSMAGVPTRSVRVSFAGCRTRTSSRSTSSSIATRTASATSTEPSRWGRGTTPHLNEFFCVPQARFLGVSPQDIVDYELPTHPLKDVDIKRPRTR